MLIQDFTNPGEKHDNVFLVRVILGHRQLMSPVCVREFPKVSFLALDPEAFHGRELERV